MNDPLIKALIMAAGYGTRLEPLTLAVPKPMVMVVNKPIMQHNIELLSRYGLKDVVANIHYHPEQIENYFSDGSKFSVSLQYSYEKELMGTAGGVKKMAKLANINKTFLILSSDALTDIDLSKLLEFHKKNKALMTMALAKVADTSQFGVVVLDQENKIVRFQEKPKKEEALSNLVNTGIYVCEPEVLDLIPENKFYDFAKDVFPKILQQRSRLMGYEIKKYWSDAGTLDQYLYVNFDILRGKVNALIPGQLKSKGVWVEHGAHISPLAKIIGPIVIGARAYIGDNAQLKGPLTIGSMTIVEANSIVQESVIWSKVYVGQGCQIKKSIIGNWCHIDSSPNPIEACVIGNRSKISSSAQLAPKSRLDPDSLV